MSKFKETEIQQYIWDHRADFWDMIQEPTFEAKPKSAPDQHEPWELLYYSAMERYEQYYRSLEGINLFGCEVHLPKTNESTIRADFLGDFDGENGLVVCELKVNTAPARQSYTEILAYANHVRSAFAPMSRQDIFYLLVSPMEERIVREATLNTLVYDNNRVVALIPVVGNTLESLTFKVWIPSKEDFKLFSKTAFASENIDTFKVCWRGVGKWSPKEKGAEPDEKMIHQLNQVSAYAAQLMEASGINGFVFCSQSYPQVRDNGFLENSITICGVNPFKAAKTKLLYEHGASLKEAAETNVEYLSIFNIFPSLQKRCKEENTHTNHWEVMSSVWSSNITRIAFDVQKRLTQQMGVSVDRDRGGMTWEDYLHNSDEDRACWNYDIHLTGVLRELYDLYLQSYFDCIEGSSKKDVEEFCEYYGLSDSYIDMLNSQDSVRNFIRRLVSDDDEECCEYPQKDEDLIFHRAEHIDLFPLNLDLESFLIDRRDR